MESEYEALLNAGVENVVKAGIGKVNAARATAELILTEQTDTHRQIRSKMKY